MWSFVLGTLIVLVVVSGFLWLLWIAFASRRRRHSKLSRGIGNASARYNEIYGVGPGPSDEQMRD